jgi:hypothetical protein
LGGTLRPLVPSVIDNWLSWTDNLVIDSHNIALLVEMVVSFLGIVISPDNIDDITIMDLWIDLL